MIAAPTGTVTFVFSDVEGSTALLQSLGRERYLDVVSLHHDLLRRTWVSRGGYEVDTAGDGFLIAFATATEAITAAAEAQQALSRAAWPHGAAVRVRVGIHSGEASFADGRYVGVSVNHAARICSAGHGGQIVVSQAAAELCRDEPAAHTLLSLGLHRLKDFDEPQVLYQVGADAFPALRTRAIAHLPQPANELVGRAEEVARVRELVLDEGRRLVTVTGAGGTGKTRFALEVTHSLVDAFNDGAYFVPLAVVAGPEWVPSAVARVLGVREQPGRELAEVVRDFAVDKRMLLLVDNLEHVLDAVPFLADVLAAAPDVVMLTTSREALKVEHECEFPLDPLDVDAAVQLFTARVRDALPGFESNGSHEAVAAICRRVDGLPLALELAAARVKLLGIDGLRAALEQSLDVLRGNRRDVPARQQALRATIEWSYGLLEPEERRVCTELSVFADGCTLDAALDVCETTIDVLASLLDKHLIRRREGDDEIRFWQLQMIREYGLERLGGSVRDRHLDYYTGLVSRAAPELWRADQMRWLRLLDHERENLRAALEHGLRGGAFDQAARLAAGLLDYWDIRGSYREADAWLSEALSSPTRLSPETFGRVATGAAVIAERVGRFTSAIPLLLEAVDASRSAGDVATEVRALQYLAPAFARLGETERAAAFTERVVEASRRTDDDMLLYLAQCCLAQVAAQTDPRAWREHVLGELAIARRAGDRRNEAIDLRNLSEAELVLGRVEEADAHLAASTELAHEVEDRMLVADNMGMLGALRLVQGRDREAVEAAGRSLALSRELGAYAAGLDALAAAALLAARDEDPGTAVQLLAVFERLVAELAKPATEPGREATEAVRTAVAKLDADAIARAYAQGRALSNEEAFRLAEASIGRSGEGQTER